MLHRRNNDAAVACARQEGLLGNWQATNSHRIVNGQPFGIGGKKGKLLLARSLVSRDREPQGWRHESLGRSRGGDRTRKLSYRRMKRPCCFCQCACHSRQASTRLLEYV